MTPINGKGFEGGARCGLGDILHFLTYIQDPDTPKENGLSIPLQMTLEVKNVPLYAFQDLKKQVDSKNDFIYLKEIILYNESFSFGGVAY